MAKKGLGRGLGSLIPDYDEHISSGGAVELKLIDIEPGTSQPRRSFDKEKLAELTESVATHGVIQPILVVKKGDGYRIIAGERRWRAAKAAGLKAIPAIVRDYDEIKTHEVALIENLQREDLNPIEEALGYKSLMEKFKMTQEYISERVGKSRSSVANALRLLSLPTEIVNLIEDGSLSSGHAKVILSLPTEKQRLDAALHIANKGLSVRETEVYIKSLLQPKKKKEYLDSQMAEYIKELEKNISGRIGTKVKIKYAKGKGKIELEYYSNDELERILEFLKL